MNHSYYLQAIFLAQGPSLKSGLEIRPFQNVELYNLMCDLIGVTPAPNNGTYGSLHHVLRTPKSLPVRTPPNPTTPTFPASREEVVQRQNAACSARCAASSEDVLAADLRLNVSAAQIARRWASSLPYGVIDAADQVVLTNSDYTVGYGTAINGPLWVSFSTRKGVEVSFSVRFESFYTDKKSDRK